MRKQLKLDNLVLLAADIDLEVAMQRLVGEALGSAMGRVTVYANRRDQALAAAKALFNSRQRVGAIRPTRLSERQKQLLYEISNLDLVLYDGRRGGAFAHGYFRNPAVSSDLFALLRYDDAPGDGKRADLERVDGNIWRITDDYLAQPNE